MDEKPFLEFRIDAMKDAQVEELKKFHKSYFDLDTISETASVLMYLGELRAVIQREITDPSDELTKHFTKLVYEGSVTQKVLDKFRSYVRQTFAQYINDVITERLQLASVAQAEAPVELPGPQATEPPSESESASKLMTTQEELEGYIVIRSLLHGTVDLKRIAYRDQQSFFSILLDDNNRKPICKLWYNGSKKYIGIFDANKVETKHPIESNDDLFGFAAQLQSVVKSYAASSTAQS
jgi:hypothetical protein